MSKINLRALEPQDIEILYKWENDSSLWHLSNTVSPYSKYLLEQYILSTENDIFKERQLRLMITVDENNTNVTVGIIDIFDFDPHNKRAGLGIIIDSSYRNKGYASEALKKIIKYSFETLNLKQLYSNILESNEASLKLFKSAGFEVVGLKKDWTLVNNKWENEYLLQLVNL